MKSSSVRPRSRCRFALDLTSRPLRCRRTKVELGLVHRPVREGDRLAVRDPFAVVVGPGRRSRCTSGRAEGVELLRRGAELLQLRLVDVVGVPDDRPAMLEVVHAPERPRGGRRRCRSGYPHRRSLAGGGRCSAAPRRTAQGRSPRGRRRRWRLLLDRPAAGVGRGGADVGDHGRRSRRSRWSCQMDQPAAPTMITATTAHTAITISVRRRSRALASRCIRSTISRRSRFLLDLPTLMALHVCDGSGRVHEVLHTALSTTVPARAAAEPAGAVDSSSR